MNLDKRKVGIFFDKCLYLYTSWKAEREKELSSAV